MAWISVRNWRKFQHYDPSKRAPIWVKNYTDLMDDEDYMNLTPGDALVLHRLWLEYAKTRCRLHADTGSLSRRLNVRVTKATLERLNHAGWIDIVASKLLADGYQDASPEVEVEVEKEKPPNPNPALDVDEALAKAMDALAAQRAQDELLEAIAAGTILKDIPE